MLKLPIDSNGEISNLTYVLAKRNYDKIGILQNITTGSTNQALVNPNEFSLTCYKKLNGKLCNEWDKIDDNMLLFIPEIDEYYNISLSIDESNGIIKTMTCTSLCHYELSNLKLYNIEINTDIDIEREEYKVPTQFLNRENEEASLLHRLLKDKAPHYTIGHVDDTLRNIQRIFSFDSTSINDALQNIAQEINCLFMFDTTTRTIMVYDELSYCNSCKTRGEFVDECNECNSRDVINGYGKDTSLLITSEVNTEQINLTKEDGSSFNCFRLAGGDDYFNSTLRSINPNGTNYIYYFGEDDRNKMPIELVEKIDTYNSKVKTIEKSYMPDIDENIKNNYNDFVDKYNAQKYATYKYNQDGDKELTNNAFIKFDDNIVGYQKLINLYYDNIDMQLYLEHSLMPNVNNDIIKATSEISKLTEESLSPLGLQTVAETTSSQTVESAIKNYSKIFVNSRYKVKIDTSSFDYEGENEEGYNIANWSGTITLTNYSDEEDIATSLTINIKVSDNYDYYMEQKIKKALKNDDDDSDQSIFDIINLKNDNDFINALTFYSSSRLNSYLDAYQSGLDILIETDQASEGADLYEKLYIPYKKRLSYIQIELDLRIKEIELCNSVADEINGKNISKLQKDLDLKQNLSNLWTAFWSYIREEKYENSNYISDGLNNKNLIVQANKFIGLAKKELIKASTPILNIETSLNNLLCLKEINKQYFIDNFKLGNWLRASVDNKIYRLRLIGYSYSFDSESNSQIQVTFSNVTRNSNPLQQSKKMMDNIVSISSSYPSIEKQMDKNNQTNDYVNDFVKNGLDVTKVKIFNSKGIKKVIQDKNGITIRGYDDINDEYSPEQIKLTNSTIAITDDNWESVKTAIGKFYYNDPLTNEVKMSYGINAQVLVGNLLIGKGLIIKTNDSSFIIGDDGMIVNSNTKSSYKNMFRIQKDGIDQMWIDNVGVINAKGLKLQDGSLHGGSIKSNNYIKDNTGMLIDLSNGNIDSVNFKLQSGSITLTDGLIKSKNYIAGSSGTKIDLSNGTIDTKNFKLDSSGNVVANTGMFSGKIIASSGNIGDLSINKSGFSYSGRRNVEFGLDSGLTGLVDLSVLMRVPDELDGSILSWNAHPISFVTDDLYGEISVGGINLGFTGSILSGRGDITNLESYSIYCDELNVSGTKKRIINTKSYEVRSQYCYEMASPFFGDIGQGKTDDEGVCYIYIDDIFKETISDLNYYVFLQSHSSQSVYVYEKTKQYFVIKGSPNTIFEWELKARQRGYDQERLEMHEKDIFVDIQYENNASNELLKYLRGGDL